jgi:hypothetical protein
MVFRWRGKEYCGRSALEIVNALKRETHGIKEKITAREFVLNSFAELSRCLPLGRIDTAGRFDDETFALSYLCLRDEKGLGELSGVPNRDRRARPLNLA